MKRRGRIYIGTSGWHYDHWRGLFYPGDMTAEGFLEYYAERFHTVEINNTFYRMPEKKTLTGYSGHVAHLFRACRPPTKVRERWTM